MTTSSVGPLARFGSQIGHQTFLYGSTSVAAFFFAIVRLGVLARFLTLREFAALALLNLLATFLTVIYNLGTLQGTSLLVFGAGAEEGVEDDDAEVPGFNVRRTLTTGLILTVLVCLAGSALVISAAQPLSVVVLPDGHESAHLVVLAAVTGAIGSVWRFTVNVLRFERRPWAFAGLTNLRGLLGLAASVPVILGYGVEGAIVGAAAATSLATLVAIFAARRNYTLAFDGEIARQIWSRGAYTVPFIVMIWIVHNVDLYLLSLFGTDSEVAQYRVASRIGAGMAYFVSAFLFAWAPLTRTALYAAVQRRPEGRDPGGALITYFLATCLWISLALSALADVLIRIAPAAYSVGAPLIPVVAVAFIAYGFFTIVQRLGRYPRKRLRLFQLSALAVIIFLAGGLLLIPRIGAYGAPISQTAAFLAAGAVAVWLGRRAENPLPLEVRRVLTAAVVGSACIVTSQLSRVFAEGWHLGIDLALLGAFPALLVFTGVTPLAEVRPLLRALSGRGRFLPGKADISAELHSQPHQRARALALMVRERREPAEAAAVLATSVEEVLSEATRGLRRVAGAVDETEFDVHIGSYLFVSRTVPERDVLARRLWSTGADPLDIERLEAMLRQLRRLPPRAWPPEAMGTRE